MSVSETRLPRPASRLRRHAYLRRTAWLAVLSLMLLGACTGEEPRSLALTPDFVEAMAGSEVTFTAQLLPEDQDADFVWSAAHGVVSGSGAVVDYTVPSSQGTYALSVAVSNEPALVAHAVVRVVPAPPTLELLTSGAEPRIVTGGTLGLVADGAGSFAGELTWDASGGSVDAEGAFAVYTAPEEPGEYVIGVEFEGFPQTRSELTVEVPGGLTAGFSLVVIPDTQTMVRYPVSATRVQAIGQWIVGALEERDIAFVTHVGDVVWHPDNNAQWTRAMYGLGLLHGAVPYSISLGDHEYLPEENKEGDTSAYRAYFGPQRFTSFDWYRGSHPDGLSHYQVFEAGGREFLHLNLEWEPIGPATDPTTPLGWAKSVLAAHPHLPTLITTHAYLWDEPGQEGRFPDSAREGWRLEGATSVTGFTTSGQGIFQALVEPHPQVLAVFNGHYHKHTEDASRRGEYHQVSTNAAGGAVYEMLANYQWDGNEASVGGDDWIRIVTFVPGEGGSSDRIEVETFSPRRAANDEPAYKEGEWSRFGFDIDFAQRFALR